MVTNALFTICDKLVFALRCHVNSHQSTSETYTTQYQAAMDSHRPPLYNRHSEIDNQERSPPFMAAASFVHLHLHTHYSLLDGATRIAPLIARAKQFNMPAVAITDHGNLFGAVEFHSAAVKAGIKPIIGLEAYLARADRRTKRTSDESEGKEAYHLLLLAMNLEGYRNLLKLASIGYIEGFYRKPRIDKEVLREHAAGLICTSTCIGGEIPQAFLTRDQQKAEELAKTYLEIFGPDRFFVELQDHGMDEQRMLNPELVALANRIGVATIATNDVHYLDHDDVEAHDVLCCINTGSLVADDDRFKFPSDQFYFKSTEAMASLFADYPDAITNTLHVADMCNVELDLTKRYAPVYKVPHDVTDESGQPLGAADYLRKLVYDGAKERYGDITAELRERIDYELHVITSKGFASYFLIVWDCVNYARRHGIPVGARGSGCSSVTAYCLHISSPDPIRYGLYFERFMDPDRDEMPDIDLDICQNGRQRIIDYVREKYGHVAQIITFGTLKARAVVKDVARVLGLGFEEANNLTKLIPTALNITLDKALEQEPELKKRYLSDDRTKRIIDIGRRLEGVARNAGVHAAGVVIADQPLWEFLPLYKASGQEGLVTQFDGPTVEKVGLLKMDFLGLRTLTVLERARQLAEEAAGEPIDLEQLELTDPKVYELFARGDTKGIFQFESGGMRDVILRMKPNRIEDLIAANALYRPGPMEYIPDYIARKHGQRWTTPHPIMTEVLQETYGIMVYQEQVSRLVNRLGGIELKAAFRLAKAISKKKKDMIEAMREPFLAGCGANGVNRETANEIFENILKFGGYAFNKAHSTGYAIVAYRTAWMKTYYPVEFMAALMTFEMSSTEKVAEYREACKEMGVSVEPPDINTSMYDFTVDRRDRVAIRFGLGAIKGVGAKAVTTIVNERQRGGKYKNLFDFCERVDLSAVNKSTVEALICAGAFDGTGAMRKALFDAAERAVAAGQSVQHDRRSGQLGLFGGDVAGGASDSTPQHRLTNDEWSEAEMLAREKAVLGFYITRHPLAAREALLDACATASTVDLNKYSDGSEVILGGMVSSIRPVVTKGGRNAGKKLAIVTLEDLKGRTEAILFPKELEQYGPLLTPDAVVFVQGHVDRKREEPSLRVSRVIPDEQAYYELARGLLIDVPSDAPIEAIVSLFVNHKASMAAARIDGNGSEAKAARPNGARGRSTNGAPVPCPVYFNVETEDELNVQIECHPRYRVLLSPALLDELFNLVGQSRVHILGPRSNRPLPKPMGSAAV
jgi:DNA polymerase III subunit alpha